MPIRKATLSDLPALVKIYNQAILEQRNADTTIVTKEDRMPWFESHQVPNYPLYVVEKNSEVVGYGTLSLYRGGRAALRYIVEVSYYIDKAYQRQGIGSQLLEYLLKAAEEIGFKHVFAILLDTNLASVRLLEKYGFECWGHLPNIVVFENQICGQYYYGKKLLQK